MSTALASLKLDLARSNGRKARWLHSPAGVASSAESAPQKARVESEEVWQYCNEHGLVAALPRVLALVRECFPQGRDLGLRVAVDPEVGDDWIVVELRIPGTVEEYLRANDEYTQRLVASLPPDQWLRICLSCHIV